MLNNFYFSIRSSHLLLILCLFITQIYAGEKTNTPPNKDYQKLFETVFGKKQKIPPQLKAKILIDQQIIKTTLYSQDGVNITHINAYPLVSRLESQLRESAFESLQDIIDKKNKIAIKELKDIGIKAKFDHLGLRLTLTIAEHLKAPNGYRKVRRRINPNQLEQPADFSGYLNIYSALEQSQTKNSINYRLESNLNYKGVAFETKWSSNKGQQGQKWIRNNTKITYDDTENLRRYIIGDISTSLSNPSVNLSLAGISLSKEYRIDPYQKITPTSTQSLVLTSSADIEIYLQGKWVKKVQLKAGEYRLVELLENENIGNQQVRLKITDRFGQKREEVFNLYQGSGLLKKGLSRYKFAVGIPSYRENQQLHYNSNEYIISADYHYGINSSLTAGLSLISNGTLFGLGLDTAFSTAFGDSKIELNAVGDSTTSAYAVGLHHSMKFNLLEDKPLAFNADLYAYNQNYSHLSYNNTQQQLINNPSTTAQALRLNLGFSQQLSEHLNIRLNSRYAQYYAEKEDELSNSLNLSYIFDKGYRLSLGVNHKQSANSKNDLSFSVNLSIPLSSKSSFKSSYNDSNKSWRVNYNQRINSKDNRLRASFDLQQDKNKPSLNTNLHYQHPRFETNLRYKFQQNNQQNGTLNFNTALVFADNTFSLSSPINESFALITGPDGQTKPIAVRKGSGSFHYSQEEQLLPDYYNALIDQSSPAVIPNLSDYSLQHLRIDNKALPLGADLSKTDFDLQPSYHRGYALKAGGEVGVIVDGYLIDKKGEKLKLEGGELLCNNKTIPFFTNRAGRFRLMSVPVGKCQLSLFNFPKLASILLIIPNKKGKLYNLGEITIKH